MKQSSLWPFGARRRASSADRGASKAATPRLEQFTDWHAWRSAGPLGGKTLLRPRDFRDPLDRTALEAAMRARCHTVPVAPYTVLCRILGHYKCLVDSRDEAVAPHLMLDGFWEFWVTATVARLLRPRQVAYDVGAHLGYYAVMMADIVGPQGHVVAVEPNPRLADLLRRNLAMNGLAGRSSVHVAAASDRAGGKLRVVSQLGNPLSGQLVTDDAPLSSFGEGAVESRVPAVRLDDLDDRPADLVKVDTGGGEDAIWAGMQQLVARSPEVTILFGYNAARSRDGAALLRDMAGRFPLRELGHDATIRPLRIEEALARQENTMLYLTRREDVRGL